MIILESKGVEKRFGQNQILKRVNIKIEKGQLVGIKGESGAGKTTFLKLLIGYTESDEGDIFYKFKKEKYHINKIKGYDNFYNQIGFSCQEGSFYDNLDVYENLDFYGTMYGLRKDEINLRIKKILPLVNLSGKERVLAGNLSAGMQKRLDIACALIHEPQIVFLDEPTAHLDKDNQNEVWKLIKRINKKGMTVVVTSHFPQDLKKYCSCVFNLKEGKLR